MSHTMFKKTTTLDRYCQLLIKLSWFGTSIDFHLLDRWSHVINKSYNTIRIFSNPYRAVQLYEQAKSTVHDTIHHISFLTPCFSSPTHPNQNRFLKNTIIIANLWWSPSLICQVNIKVPSNVNLWILYGISHRFWKTYGASLLAIQWKGITGS